MPEFKFIDKGFVGSNSAVCTAVIIYIYIYIYIYCFEIFLDEEGKKSVLYNEILYKSHDIILKINADLLIERPTLSRYIEFP